ncbi:MAG: Maf family protein [Anaerolineae bacterium]
MARFNIRRLILASTSPRRRQLMPLLGIPFLIKSDHVAEQRWPEEPPTEYVLRISQAKALAIPQVRSDELVVAADTTVVLDGDILEKPKDREEAIQMLSRLRGRAHVVYSGVAVWHPASQYLVCELSESQVWMRDYTESEIVQYVATGDPLDKAGAYAIQHPIFDPVVSVDGCWLTVMGFPLCHLSRALARFGVVVPANVPGACQAFTQRSCPVFPAILTQRG